MLKTVSTANGLVSPTFSGNVTLSDGNLVIGTSGKGIDFSATPGTGTSELFDDYEEGTFTPVLRDNPSGNAATAASSLGNYTKIGDTVFFRIDLVDIDTTGLTLANQLYITGLPFSAVSSKNLYYPSSIIVNNVTATTGAISAIPIQGNTLLAIVNNLTNGFSAMLVSAVLSGTGDIYINGTYQTA